MVRNISCTLIINSTISILIIELMGLHGIENINLNCYAPVNNCVIDIQNIWNVQVSTLHKVWTSVKFFWYFLSVRMIACALALVHDFHVMYFVLKSCTLFVKKVIGRNSRKLVAAKYYWRGNTFLIFHILPSSSLENVFLSSLWISMFAIGRWKYTLKSNLNEILARIEYINVLDFETA